MTPYERFKSMNIDHSAIGMELRGTNVHYYCTPKDAKIIGWAGVDGIHYCTIPEFGEMIFAVSPMNFGDCVHPIARSFEDLLRMLLYCVDMAALEQCYTWDEEQFKAFLIDCPATPEQQAVLDAIRDVFQLQPMEDTFAYVKKLQSEFDLSKIPYTEDYYDEDMNPAAPVSTEWIVTYDGGFWNSNGQPGKEISIGKSFCWGEESWYIPAVYVCGKGLVIDFCMEKDPAAVQAFIDKWDLYNEDKHHYTKIQQEQISREHPLNAHFSAVVHVNGKKLHREHGCGLSWIPVSVCPAGAVWRENDANRVMEHYRLDDSKAWSFHRCSFKWVTEDIPNLNTLRIKLIRSPEQLIGDCFPTPAVGESITLPHPHTGAQYTLTVLELEQMELPPHAFRNDGMEYPTHYLGMSYTLEPEISGREFLLQDCAESDHPRMRKLAPNGYASFTPAEAAAIGIIGGADGPTAIIMGAPSTPKMRTSCSALHFEPVADVVWCPRFSVKLMEDIHVELI